VVRGQDNRVAEPKGVNFVTMTPIMRERIETNVVTFVDGAFLSPPVPGTRSDLQPVKLTAQLDVHGPASADNAQIIATLFRSEYATTQFSTSGFDVTPLYCGDPHQMPFQNGEQQVEDRWVIDAVMQCNPVVTTTQDQDFAAQLVVKTYGVGAEYPVN